MMMMILVFFINGYFSFYPKTALRRICVKPFFFWWARFQTTRIDDDFFLFFDADFDDWL